MSITERKLKNGKTVYDNAFMYKGTRYKKGGFKKKSDAEDWEINVKYEINHNGYYFTPCGKTFIQVYAEAFEIEKEKKKFKPNTINSYYVALNHVKKNKISKTKIMNLTYKDIQKYFNQIAKDKGKSTCESIKKLFNLTFKYAMRSGYIKIDPMPYVECKGIETANKEKRKTISFNEFELITQEFLNKSFGHHSIYIALYIGYYTGARISEIGALNKNDIDFENNLIHFTKKLEYKDTKNGLYTNSMKTKSSYAAIPLVPQLCPLLKEWFEINPYERVICHENGDYLSYNFIQKHIKAVSLKLGIPFHSHMLRHTYASNIVNSGVNINVAKKLLRHSKIETTLDVYTHSDIQDEIQALRHTFSINNDSDYPKITPKPN